MYGSGQSTPVQNQPGFNPNAQGAGAAATAAAPQSDPDQIGNYSNLFWANDVVNDSGFKSNMMRIIEYAKKNGLTDFDDLNKLAGDNDVQVHIGFGSRSFKRETKMQMDLYNTPGGPVIIISVDPRSGIILLDGKRQSSATGVIHEVSHGIDLMRGPGVAAFARMSKVDRDAWGNADEMSVINGAEARTARAFGEPTRNTHTIKNKFHPLDPTSNK